MPVINPKEFFVASQYRNIEANDFLTVTSLPYFIGETYSQVAKQNFPYFSFTKYAPKDSEIASPGITYRIYRRTPGLDKQDTLKPSLKHLIYEENSVKHVYTQYQSVTYEFVVYGLDTTEVDDLVDSFESFLFQIQPELQKKYVQHFVFEEEVREDFANLSKKVEEQYKRVLRYTATIQKPFILDYGLLSSISLKAGITLNTVEDVPVFRSAVDNIDIIETPIEWDVIHLSSVSSLKDIELKGRYQEISVVSGNIVAQNYLLQQVYIPDIDYVLYSFRDPETGYKKKAISWTNFPGSKKPLANSLYYVSWKEPKKVLDQHIIKK
jgi:hypothetical protein